MEHTNHKDLLTWCDDLHQVKGNISQFQATLHQILNKSPTIEEFKELTARLSKGENDNRGIGDKTRSLLTSAQLKVAIRMKFLFEQGLLPFLLSLSHINLKSSKSDRFVGYLLDYTPPRDVGAGLSNILKQKLTTKKVEVDEPYPPSLPPISNQNLLNQALTDKSMRMPSDFLESFESNDFTFAHNSKLAQKGRLLLEFCLSEILDNKLPHLHEDDLSYLTHTLASSRILTRFCYGYNLVEHIRNNIPLDMPSDAKLRIISNVFLAYVAGLLKDNYSAEEIKLWLSKLYDPIISRFRDNDELLKPLDNVAYNELMFLFENVTNKYEVPPKRTEIKFTTLETDPYVVRLEIDDESLGLGTNSKSLKKAKMKAAADAFSKKDKLDKLITKLISSYEKKDLNKQDEEAYSSNSEEAPYSPSFDAEEEYEPSLDINPSSKRDSQSSVQSPSVDINNVEAINSPKPYFLPALPSKPSRPGNLYTPSLQIEDGNGTSPVDNNAKNMLYALLGSNHLTPVYEFTKMGNNFQVVISVNNQIIGSSKDSNKKAASQRAAMNALSNTDALTKLGVLYNT